MQIWIRSDEEAPNDGDLRGFVEHVGSGQRAPFRSAGELLGFFETKQDQEPQEVQR